MSSVRVRSAPLEISAIALSTRFARGTLRFERDAAHRRARFLRPFVAIMSGDFPNLLVGIGASAGGLEPLVEIVDLLSHGFQGALLVATHRAPGTSNELARILQRHTRLRVSEPFQSEHISCTHIYVPHPDAVLTVDGSEFRLQPAPDRLRRLRRIDDLFVSIAESAGPNSVGVILSGALDDGVEGLKAIKSAGGTCIVQNPSDAAFKSMPQNALAAIDADVIGDPLEIASRLIELAAGRECK